MPLPRASVFRTNLTPALYRTTPRLNINNLRVRTMASGSAPLHEWLIIAPDQAGAIQKRIAARPKHLENIQKDKEGLWLMGGAMLEEPIEPGSTDPPKFKGSAMLIAARTKEEALERVKQDIYTAEGVWDADKIQIIPFKSAIRKAL
ncbi:hypothetical protein NX059_009105 [Plenodomus lindquistii]|nr:hypothetical protein NX059_009105 [Plenodomus lindquistii]